MKTTSRKFLNTFFATFFLAGFLFAPVFADSQKEVAFEFSFFNFGKEETVSDAPTNFKKIDDTSKEGVSETVALAEKEPKTSCDHFESITENVLTLEDASAEARQKIENVEDTLESESAIRENIFESVKNFLGLQKKDKVIFREMKKDLANAKIYYNDLDEKIIDTSNFLDDNSCEDTKLVTAKTKDDEVIDLVADESTYRKQFVAGLKEKVKILQTSVKDAKK